MGVASKMFSFCRFGVVPAFTSVLGTRGFAKAVTQKSIYDILNKNHTILTIPAFRRDKDGSHYSKMLRANGAIPGILYGSDGKGNDKKVLIAVPTSEVDRFRKRLNLSFENTLFYLDVEGEKTLVFPRQLSCHPGIVICIISFIVTERPENLNFIRMDTQKGTVVQIPIHYYNHDKNKEIKLGGFLSTATRFVDVRVNGNCRYVPPFINCNIENLTHKRAFGVNDLEIDRNIFKPHPKMYNRVFASIAGKVKGDTEAEAAAATAET